MRKFITKIKSNSLSVKAIARNLGLESEDTGVEIERERLMFGKIKDLSQLDKAAVKIKQEQYEIKVPKSDKNALGGKIRIRRSEPLNGGEVTFTITTKTEVPITDDASSGIESRYLEINAPATEEMFKAFQYMAEGGMSKIRYEFPVEGTDRKWEFDIFTDSQGNPQQWCKIDFEVDKNGGDDLPPFPVEMERIISNPTEQQTDEEKAILDTLFSTVFKFNNPHL